MPVLLSPPVAGLTYLSLVCVVLGFATLVGWRRQSRSHASSVLYASGERPPRAHATPGYQPFFGSALFFALLHVGVLIASVAGFQPVAVVYVAGVLVVLLVVALG